MISSIERKETTMPEHISLYKLFEMSDTGRWNAYCNEIVLPLLQLHYGAPDEQLGIDPAEKNLLKLMWHVYNLDELETRNDWTIQHILKKSKRQCDLKFSRARFAVQLLIVIFYRLQENPFGLYKADINHYDNLITWFKETSLGIIKDYDRDSFAHQQYSINSSRIDNLLSPKRTQLHYQLQQAFEVVEERSANTLYLIFERGEQVEIHSDVSVGAKHLRRRIEDVADWHEDDQFHFMLRDRKWFIQPHPFAADTFINGEKIDSEHQLSEGDYIVVGSQDNADFRVLFHSGTILKPLPQDNEKDARQQSPRTIRTEAFLEEVLFPLMQEGVTLQEKQIAAYLLSIYSLPQIHEDEWISKCRKISRNPQPVLRQESFALFAQWMYRIHTSPKVWDRKLHQQLLQLFLVPIGRNHHKNFSKKMDKINDLDRLIQTVNRALND